jgi:Phosphoesterase family
MAPAMLAWGMWTAAANAAEGIHKIRHVVIIMQENRSFDSYFGTYPGADGIPMRHVVPTVCLPDPLRHKSVRPYHDTRDVNYGGPHDALAFQTDYADRVREARAVSRPCAARATPALRRP